MNLEKIQLMILNKPRDISKKEYSLEDIRFFVCCLFVFALPLDRIYSEVFLITLLCLVLIDFRIISFKKIPKSFWAFQLFFLISVSGLLFTAPPFINEGRFLIEKQLAIFLFPILLSFSFTITERRIDILLKTLTISTSLCIIYLLAANYINYLHLNISFKEFIYSGISFNHSFSSYLQIHAGYLSMYVVLSFFYIIKKYGENKKNILILLVILHSIAIFFLASRANTMALIFILIFIYPFFYVKNKKIFISSVVISISLFGFMLVSSPYLNQKFGVLMLDDLGVKREENSEPRITRWKESLRIISESPIYGHGTGSEIQKLKEKYKEKNLIYSYFKEYNSHNQFLSIAIKHGIIGLILITLILIFYFTIAIKQKDFIYLSFLIIILFNFFIENVLDTNKGIFFFAFFNTLLGYYNLNKKNESVNISNRTVV